MNANQLTKIPVEKLSNTLRFLIAENEIPFSDALKQVIDDVDAVCKKLLRDESAPAQPVSNPYKLNSWISVADRLPSGFGRYLCYVEEQNDLGKSHYQWNCSWNGDVFSDSSLTGRITHWMPLPEPPAQESE